MKASVVGAGYVGPVSAAGLAEMAKSVVGLDIDAARGCGMVPIREPGLDDAVAHNIAALAA